MKCYRCVFLALSLMGVLSVLLACGGGGPDADIDMTARVLEVYIDRRILRVGEFDAGRKYEILVTETVPIKYGDETLALTDLKTFYQIRIWVNEVTGKDHKYEAVEIEVLDLGDPATTRR